MKTRPFKPIVAQRGRSAAVKSTETAPGKRPHSGRLPVYQRHRDLLDNGLRVVTVEVPHLHSALLAVYVRCGSRHETPQNNGVSHFLEHMFFRGSARFPDTRAMNARVEDAGGDLNGITMRDQGFYYTPLHPRSLAVGFEVLGDLLSGPRLSDLEIEREIILEEMMDEVDARGRDVDLGNLAKRLVFGDHPLALKIAGTPASVRSLNEAALREHHRRFYVAQNLVVAVSGKVERAQVLDLTQEAFGGLPRGRRTTEKAPRFGRQGPSLSFVPHDESQTELMLCFPCPPEGHPDHLPLAILRAVLDDGLSSWLPLNIVERRGLAYSVHAGIDTFNDTAVFELEAACTPAKVVPVVEEMARLLRKLGEEPLDDEELERVKRRYRIMLDFTLDDVNTLAGWYGGSELFRAPETFEERCQAVEALSARTLQQVARRTFRKDNLYVCAVGPASGRAHARLEKAVQAAILG